MKSCVFTWLCRYWKYEDTKSCQQIQTNSQKIQFQYFPLLIMLPSSHRTQFFKKIVTNTNIKNKLWIMTISDRSSMTSNIKYWLENLKLFEVYLCCRNFDIFGRINSEEYCEVRSNICIHKFSIQENVHSSILIHLWIVHHHIPLITIICQPLSIDVII